MAKRKVKNRKPSQTWKKYKIDNDKIVRAKCCPRCGQGYFLADHKDRWYCGHCKYVEIKNKKE